MLNTVCVHLGPTIVTTGSLSDWQKEWVFLHCQKNTMVFDVDPCISKYNFVIIKLKWIALFAIYKYGLELNEKFSFSSD